MKWLVLSLLFVVLFSGCVEDCMTSCLKEMEKGVVTQETMICGSTCRITEASCEEYCSGKSDSKWLCYMSSPEICEEYRYWSSVPRISFIYCDAEKKQITVFISYAGGEVIVPEQVSLTLLNENVEELEETTNYNITQATADGRLFVFNVTTDIIKDVNYSIIIPVPHSSLRQRCTAR
jgi:hypothetical protein